MQQQGNYQIQKQQQVQTLSAQQVMAIKLLELPMMELEERVRSELLDNPALEEGAAPNAGPEQGAEAAVDESGEADDSASISQEELELGDYRSEEDIPDYKLHEVKSPTVQAEEIPFSDAVSFYEVLKEQLGECELTERQQTLAEYLIGSLDDDGLLRKDFQSVEDELLFNYGLETTPKELEQVLKIIQDFDPPGIGARSLQECLLIQIARKPNSPLHDIERNIINRCYDEFTRKRWDKIQQRLNLTDEQCEEARNELVRLNPRPGSSLGDAVGRSMQQIVPDFLVETYDDGTVLLSLNDGGVPELHLSRTFCDMLEEHTKNKANQSKESRDAMLFLKQKVDAARGFIDAVKQRQQTMYNTMQAIIDLQLPFFQEGDESLLQPMILKDVALKTGLDISTISRVSNSKYVQTNHGIYPLKFFFSDGYTTDDGEELSVREIRMVLKECIDKEDKTHPLTDDELARLLKEKGYPIARRTIAKYREQLGIPVARLRK